MCRVGGCDNRHDADSLGGWRAVTRAVASPAAREAAAALETLEYFAQDVSRSVSDGAYLLTAEDAAKDGPEKAAVVQSVVVRAEARRQKLVFHEKAAPDRAAARGATRRVRGGVRHLGGVPRRRLGVRCGLLQLPREHRVRRSGAAEPGGRRGRRRRRARRHGLLRDRAAVHQRRRLRPGARVRGGRVARRVPGRHLVGQSAVLEAFGVDFRRTAAQPGDGRRRHGGEHGYPRLVLRGDAGHRVDTDDPSLETLAHMRSKSPIAHVANVAEKKRPVMMLIGAADRRVPPTNGLRYAAALRAAGGTCHVRVFPEDAHGLVKPRTEFESFVSIATFLRETLG